MSKNETRQIWCVIGLALAVLMALVAIVLILTGCSFQSGPPPVIQGLIADNAMGPYAVEFVPFVTGNEPMTYRWETGDGTVLRGENPIHDYGRHGEYIVRLTVTDAGGLTASSICRIWLDGFTVCYWETSDIWTCLYPTIEEYREMEADGED